MQQAEPEETLASDAQGQVGEADGRLSADSHAGASTQRNGTDDASNTLGEDGKPKVEGTQDEWTEEAKGVIGDAAQPSHDHQDAGAR